MDPILKAKVIGAYDFATANRLIFTKKKLFEHFGVSESTGHHIIDLAFPRPKGPPRPRKQRPLPGPPSCRPPQEAPLQREQPGIPRRLPPSQSKTRSRAPEEAQRFPAPGNCSQTPGPQARQEARHLVLPDLQPGAVVDHEWMDWPGKKRVSCKACSVKGRKLIDGFVPPNLPRSHTHRMTLYGCKDCQTALCRSPDRDCWGRWHGISR
jgi:hypothetical protein